MFHPQSLQKPSFFLILSLMFLVGIFPAYTQDNEQINKVIVEVTCVNADGSEVNAGLGTLTVDSEPMIILKDDVTAEECATLGAEVLLSQLDDETIANLLGVDLPPAEDSQPVNTEDDESATNENKSTTSTEDNEVATPENNETIETPTPIIQLGVPTNPAENIMYECENLETTGNAFRIHTMLPAGNYRVVLAAARFQTFDPLLLVKTNDEWMCSSEAPIVREYVVDFSRADIGNQVYGHNSGGAIEFNVAGSATDLSPVEIIVGGQNNSDAGTSGDFLLILEGAELSSQVQEHIYNVTLTESLSLSDTPLSVITLGIEDSMNPNLTAGIYIDELFIKFFECEDSNADCDSDNGRTLAGSSVVEAGVRTVAGDDLDAVLVKQPEDYLQQGIQEVSFIVSEANDNTSVREEYVIVFYGGIE